MFTVDMVREVNTLANDKVVHLILCNDPNLQKEVFYSRDKETGHFIGRLCTTGRWIDPSEEERYKVKRSLSDEEVLEIANEHFRKHGKGSVEIY